MSKTKSSVPRRPLPLNEGDVAIQRHALDRELGRMAGITRRLGRRLAYAIRKVPVEALPAPDWRETFKLYATTQLGLLVEQRKRAALGPEPDDEWTDEQVEAELEKIALNGLKNLSEARRRELLLLASETDVVKEPTK